MSTVDAYASFVERLRQAPIQLVPHPIYTAYAPSACGREAAALAEQLNRRLIEAFASGTSLIAALDYYEMVNGQLKYWTAVDSSRMVVESFAAIVCSPQEAVTSNVRQFCADLACTLLRDARKQDRSFAMQVPWRPLCDVLQRYLFPRAPLYNTRLDYEIENMQNVVKLALRLCRFFGPVDSDIWAEFPLEPVIDGERHGESFAFLSILLPMGDVQWVRATLLPLLEDRESVLWAFRAPHFDTQRMALVARLAKTHPRLVSDRLILNVLDLYFDHIRFPLIEGAKHGTGSAYFSAGDSRRGFKLITDAHHDRGYGAKFCARMLTHGSPFMLSSFARLCDSWQSLCHPSNTGPWSADICSFIGRVVGHVGTDVFELARVCPEAFVDSAWLLLRQLVLNKNPATQLGACQALRHLASVSAKFFPELLALAMDSLCNLNEPLRSRALISSVSNCLHAVEHEASIEDFAMLVVQSIDPNDPFKTNEALFFMVNYANAFAAVSDDLQALFLDRILNYARHLPAVGDDDDDALNIDTGSAQMIAYAAERVLSESDLARSKLMDFLARETLINAAPLIGRVLGTLPAGVFVSTILDRIQGQLAAGHGSLEHQPNSYNEELLYLLSILASILADANRVSVVSRPVYAVLDDVLRTARHRRVLQLACKCLRHMMRALLLPRPVQARGNGRFVLFAELAVEHGEVNVKEFSALMERALGLLSNTATWHSLKTAKEVLKLVNFADSVVPCALWREKVTRWFHGLPAPSSLELQLLHARIAALLQIGVPLNSEKLVSSMASLQLLRALARRYPRDYRMPPSVAVHRLGQLQLVRMDLAFFAKHEETREVAQDLWANATGPFSARRVIAQEALSELADHSHVFSQCLLEAALDTLEASKTCEEAFKGAMHVLQCDSVLNATAINHTCLPRVFRLIHALSDAPKQDFPNRFELLHAWVDDLVANLECVSNREELLTWACDTFERSSYWWIQTVAVCLLEVLPLSARATGVLMKAACSDVVRTRTKAIDILTTKPYAACEGVLFADVFNGVRAWQVHADASDAFRPSMAVFAYRMVTLFEPPFCSSAFTSDACLSVGQQRFRAEWLCGWYRATGDREVVAAMAEAWRSLDLDAINNIWAPAIKHMLQRTRRASAISVENSSSLHTILQVRFAQAALRFDPAFRVDVFACLEGSNHEGVLQAAARLASIQAVLDPSMDIRALAGRPLVHVLLAFQDMPVASRFWHHLLESFSRLLPLLTSQSEDDHVLIKGFFARLCWTRACASPDAVFSTIMDNLSRKGLPVIVKKALLTLATSFLSRYHMSMTVTQEMFRSVVEAAAELPEHLVTLLQCFVLTRPASLGPQLSSLSAEAEYIWQCALVKSFPYSIPLPWMPPVLVSLARSLLHSAASNSQLSSSQLSFVRRVFADFKRTHADSWHSEHVNAFTGEQLDVLNELLIGPSYYA